MDYFGIVVIVWMQSTLHPNSSVGNEEKGEVGIGYDIIKVTSEKEQKYKNPKPIHEFNI